MKKLRKKSGGENHLDFSELDDWGGVIIPLNKLENLWYCSIFRCFKLDVIMKH